MSTADERYQEKIRARKEGRAPVFVQALAALPTGNSPEAVDARYRAKLAARRAPPAPAPAPEADKPKAVDKGKAKPADPPAPEADKPKA